MTCSHCKTEIDRVVVETVTTQTYFLCEDGVNWSEFGDAIPTDGAEIYCPLCEGNITEEVAV